MKDQLFRSGHFFSIEVVHAQISFLYFLVFTYFENL